MARDADLKTQDYVQKWDTLEGKFDKWKQVLEGGR